MATRLIFTLGTGDYRETTYCLEDMQCTTSFAAIAALQFHESRASAKIDQAVVLVTPQSRLRNLDGLMAVWPETAPPLQALDVPVGASVDEFWQLFDVLADLIQDGDRIILDITHGLRSMPIVALLTASYLRAARPGSELAMLSYGAYEARDGERTPMFDLTPLVSLLDWTAAAQQFMRSGDAQGLADLVKRVNSDLHRRGPREARPEFLSRVITDLPRFALDLQSFRYEDAVRTAGRLRTTLRQAAESTNDRLAVRPLFAVERMIEEALEPFVPGEDESPLTDLDRLYFLLDWLLQRRLYLPYVALLRETLVCHVAWWLDLYALTDGGSREIRIVHTYATDLLNAAQAAFERREPRTIQPSGKGPIADRLRALDQQALIRTLLRMPKSQEYLPFLARVRGLRNSLMHAGFSNDDAPPDGPGIERAIREYHQAFKAMDLLNEPSRVLQPSS